MKKTKFGIITVTFLALMIGESVNADSFYFQINEHRVTIEQENLVKDEEGNVWSRDGNIWYNQLTEEQGTLMINEDVEQKVPTPVEQKVPTPVEQKVPTPVEQKVPTPVEQKVPTPVEQKVPTPVEQKVPTPVEQKVPTPVEQKVPTNLTNKTYSNTSIQHSTISKLPETGTNNGSTLSIIGFIELLLLVGISLSIRKAK